MPGQAQGFVRWFLQLDGGVLFAGSIVVFSTTGQAWWWYVVLLLAPDVSMAGYLANPTLGAFLYNLGHTYLLPAVVVLAGWLVAAPWVVAAGVIWLGHIGMDRALAYGLKYHTGFKHTHLGWSVE